MNVVPSVQPMNGRIVTRVHVPRPRRQRLRRIVVVLAGLALTASMLTVPNSFASSSRVDAVPALHTQGSRIVTESGDDFTIRAVNWFGLETSNCAPHGLWRISLDQAMDQIASFGFNTIRLPYSSECLAGAASAVSGVDAQVNPGLTGLTPIQIMDRVVDAAAARDMRVVLDRHRPDSGSQSELWYTDRFSEQQWISDWVMLATRYSDQSAVIGADLHNEPHGPACWGCGDPTVDWAAAATRAGNAILAVDPHWLIVVEGVENQNTAGSTWWGGGLADVAAHPITLTVSNQVVYSPHDYPASVFAQNWFADPGYPANLPALWDKNWGYIAEQGIAPVLLGEFGTALATPSDVAWLDTLVGYLGARQLGFAYWSYNPNSGDTGGLVADDWRTPQQAKLDALAPLLVGNSPPATTPSVATTNSPPPVIATSSGAPAPPSISATPSSPIVTTPSAATSSAAPPSGTTTPAQSSTATSAVGASVAASWRLQSSWQSGYVAQLVVTAGSAAITEWSVSWPDSHAQLVANAWGIRCLPSAGLIRCTGADWAQRIPAGGSVTVGLQVDNDGTAPAAPPLTVA